MKYFIEYGCGCGDEYEVIEAKSEDSAWEHAHQCAIANYQSFEGYHGIMDLDDVKEEYEIEDEEEAFYQYEQEVENTIYYSAIEFDESNEEHVDCLHAQGGTAYLV